MNDNAKEFDRERTKRLEQEIKDLKTTIKGLERDLARAERRNEEFEELVSAKDARIDSLQTKIVKLVSAYV